ncbi:Kinesin and/or SCP-1 domain containing protein, partial [Asbolus verrucosus]
PFTGSEVESKTLSIIKRITQSEIVLKSGSTEKKYNFDRVFGEEASQAEIYNVVVYPLIDYIISGYNCTVFAYGQTGTGKTHTMIGSIIGPRVDFNNDISVGMIPRAAVQLFSQLEKLDANTEYTVTVSFIEIYNEEVRDLLVRDSTPLRIFDDPESKGSIYMKGLTDVTVCNTNEVYEWLSIGTMERQTASTNLNRHSSRSHTIFTLMVRTRETTVDGEELIKTGKLHLIDLAGSENIGRSGATEMRAREAGTINKSLLTLGKVIKALAQKMQHIPYRDSKLTRILQDSLGGKTKTCMIATFTPCVNAWDETISTLDYANVARCVANCPQINVNRKQTNVIKDLKNEIGKLRHELTAARTGEGFYMSQTSYDNMTMDIQKNNERIMHLLKEIRRLEEYKLLKEEQYQKVNESFVKTKSYLDKIKQELEERNTQDQQNEYLIGYMNKRDRELTATANLLLKICETSTKHQEIYYTKYDAQCNSTVSNANIGKSAFSTSAKCLREVQNASEKFVENQETYLRDVKETAASLKEKQGKSLEALTQFSLDLESMVPNCNMSFDKMANNSTLDYTESSFYNNLITIFSDSNHLQLEKQKDIKNSVEILKNHLVAKDAEMLSKSTHCLRLKFKTSLSSYVERANSIRESFVKSTMEDGESINTTMKHISNCTKTHNDDIKKFVQQSVEGIQKLEENIVFTAHVGDTPAKTMYSYPKTIENRIHSHVLIEEFKNAAQDSSESLK